MNIEEFLTLAAKEEASDLFIVAGLPLTMKVNGVMRRINEEKMMPQDTEKIIREIYEKALDRDIDQLLKTGDDDFSFAIPGLSRFRVSAYKQRGSLAAVIRVIAFRLPDYKQLRIPEQVMKLSELNKGLVLVTGPAGSGKSTTLACMIEEINETKEDHIITLEDPLEFLHQHKKSIVSQREVNMDTVNYVTSLRAALRQSPDVILLDSGSYDSCRNRASGIFNTSYHRGSEYDRTYHRCTSTKSATPDHDSAGFCITGSDLSAADTNDGWNIDSCV